MILAHQGRHLSDGIGWARADHGFAAETIERHGHPPARVALFNPEPCIGPGRVLILFLSSGVIRPWLSYRAERQGNLFLELRVRLSRGLAGHVIERDHAHHLAAVADD